MVRSEARQAQLDKVKIYGQYALSVITNPPIALVRF